MPDLTNDFSWSRSRDNVFSECKRRYFYHYYGAWGGWEAGATEDVRRLYVLKQLASRQMWGGRVVHDAIEMALHIFGAGRDETRPLREVEAAISELRPGFALPLRLQFALADRWPGRSSLSWAGRFPRAGAAGERRHG